MLKEKKKKAVVPHFERNLETTEITNRSFSVVRLIVESKGDRCTKSNVPNKR